jgi:hypothetical protein
MVPFSGWVSGLAGAGAGQRVKLHVVTWFSGRCSIRDRAGWYGLMGVVTGSQPESFP